MICAPTAGMLLAIYLDNKIIIPIETATGIGNVFEKINNKKKSTEKSEGTSNNITINIGNQNQDNIPDMQLKHSSGLLSKDIVDDEDFNSKIVDVINEIKNEQSAQSEIISQNTEKLEDLSDEFQKVTEKGNRIALLEEGFQRYLESYNISVDAFMKMKNTDKSDKLMNWLNHDCIDFSQLTIK